MKTDYRSYPEKNIIVFSGTGYFADHMVYWLRDTEYKLRNVKQFSAGRLVLVCMQTKRGESRCRFRSSAVI